MVTVVLTKLMVVILVNMGSHFYDLMEYSIISSVVIYDTQGYCNITGH